MKSIPWIPYAAAEYLSEVIKPTWDCFEWGSGGSTLWLEKLCGTLITVEHNPIWGNILLEQIGPTTELLLIPPELGSLGSNPSNPDHYKTASTAFEGRGINWKAYASAIDNVGPFDLVMVDGRSRASCLAHAVPRIKCNGYLCLDNSERTWYTKMVGKLLSEWEEITFTDHGPRLACRWNFTIWRNQCEKELQTNG